MVGATWTPMTLTWLPTRKQWGCRPFPPSPTLPSRTQMLPTTLRTGYTMPCRSDAWLGVYGGWDLDVHDVDVDPVADPKAVWMQTVPMDPDPAIPALDASNNETCWAWHVMSEQSVAGCVWGVRPGCP